MVTGLTAQSRLKPQDVLIPVTPHLPLAHPAGAFLPFSTKWGFKK